MKENNKEIIGGICTGVSERFQRGVMKDMSRSLKANIHDSGVVEKIIFEERADEGARTFKDNICGTIRTIDSGEDKRVAELNRLGNIYGEGRGTGYAGNVWDKEGLCPTLTTMEGGNREPMIVASRGRNKENPSDRTAGAEVEQRLEPNSQGICNTLTSVQKNNCVLEPRLVGGIGEINFGTQYRQGNRVYDSNAIAMCLLSQPVGNTGGNSYLYAIKEGKGEPTVKVKQATKEGYIECKLGGVADLSYPTSQTRRGRVQEKGEISPTITATETGVHKIESPYRIRKLTPLECWRLMKFTDEDFHKAEKVNSNSQLYKQAGNSIVVDVLEAIFKQMI